MSIWALICLWVTPSISLDFDSYCAGFCRARYSDGIYRNGKCFCGDYYPVNLGNRILMPAKPRPMGPAMNGVDDMHYPAADD